MSFGLPSVSSSWCWGAWCSWITNSAGTTTATNRLGKQSVGKVAINFTVKQRPGCDGSAVGDRDISRVAARASTTANTGAGIDGRPASGTG